MYKRYILVCEKGWRKIRESSLELASKNMSSTVLIRGLVEKDVREMITRHDRIKNIFIPEKIFLPFLFVYVLIAAILSYGRLSISLSKDKTYNRLNVFKKVFHSIELIKAFE